MEYNSAVDLSGLMQVLSEHLYSTPNIAVRELVQNGHDSVTRRRLTCTENFEGRIEVSVDEAACTIEIADSGIGLTRQEIIGFLATIGAGQTRLARVDTGSDALIGQFGLGFLSAFSVADLVTVTTTPLARPGERWRYRSSGGTQFELADIADGQCRSPGSQVSLHLKPQHRSLLDPAYLGGVLAKYCALLPEPIYVVGEHGPEQVNISPPWRDPRHSLLEPEERRAAALAFAARFEPGFEPICTIEVVPFGSSDARGLLWVQGGSSYGSSDNRRMSVFVRGMMLDDDARNLLPTWAGFVGGVVESASLIPTASREDLQRTAAYDAVQAAISETLIVGMASLPRSQPAIWRRVAARHNEALLGASIVDDRLFDVIARDLTVPTTQGDRRAEDLVVDGAVHLGSLSGGSFVETMYRALKRPIARGERYAVAPFVRRWAERERLRLVEIGTETGNDELFAPVTATDADLRFLTRVLAGPGEAVSVARFEPNDLAMVSIIDRDADLKHRLDDDEADRRISAMALQLARLYTDRIKERPLRTLFVNMACPAIGALIAANVMGNTNLNAAAALLRATKTMLDTSTDEDLAAALRVVNTTVERILEI
jgi:molecular chaperone HtpG